MKNRNLVIVILAVICAGLLAGVVYTVTKGKSGTQKKQEASAEAGADETESQSGIIEEDGKKYKINPDIKTVLFMGVDKEEKADLGNNPGENGQSDSLNLLALNKEEKTAQIIQISRDSMVGIDIYDVTGTQTIKENVPHKSGENKKQPERPRAQQRAHSSQQALVSPSSMEITMTV